ncbi:hypothetical protein ACI2K4_11780 [Micromonospora sp. NPDC050397]|uniref:hypothetical protein n=1 Tax=Micromonospora sp. NPDC050397 TaxID=3364279 RepID=UPI00384DCD57
MIAAQAVSRAGDEAKPNEDSFVVAAPGLLAVLDGVSAVEGMDSGCVHGPAWYASRLAANLERCYTDAPEAELADLVAEAIGRVCGEHGSTCDLDHPGTPQSTLVTLRIEDDECDYLVLCDSTLVLDCSGRIETVSDLRIRDVARSYRHAVLSGTDPIGSNEQIRQIQELTVAKQRHVNREGGYWIAAANPSAAHHAVRGSVPGTGPGRLTRAALLTDGASSVVDLHHITDWRGLLDLAQLHGPGHLVQLAREAEDSDPTGSVRPRPKSHDDATVVYCVIDSEVHP